MTAHDVITKRAIKRYLPHRAPILLLNEAYDWTPDTLVATTAHAARRKKKE